MSPQRSRKAHSRITEVDLVAGAAIEPEISESAAKATVVAVLVILLALLTTIIAWRSSLWLLVILLPLDMWLTDTLARRLDGATVAQIIHEKIIVPRRKLPEVHEAPYEHTMTAGGITAGEWALPATEYDQVRRVHGAEKGRSAEPPPVPYKLVVATYRVDGNQQAMAFSDGTSAHWHRAQKIIVARCRQIETIRERPKDEDIRSAATALADVIELLDEADARMSVRTIAGRLDGHSPSALGRALDVALWWKLIHASAEASDSGDDYENVSVGLTPAGHEWHVAPSQAQAGRDTKRRTMTSEPSGSPNIHIGTFSGILNAGGHNVFGKNASTVHNGRPSDDQVIACLREILDLPQIPWSDSTLLEARQVVEQAVARRDPRMPGLRQAVARLKAICGELALGVIGNGAYDLLVRYFS